jgi:hypothetical protein
MLVDTNQRDTATEIFALHPLASTRYTIRKESYPLRPQQEAWGCLTVSQRQALRALKMLVRQMMLAQRKAWVAMEPLLEAGKRA